MLAQHLIFKIGVENLNMVKFVNIKKRNLIFQGGSKLSYFFNPERKNNLLGFYSYM